MLFTIALSLALVRARGILALVHRRGGGMLVVNVAVLLLLCGPSICMVFAAWFTTFPRSRVCLLMFTIDLLAKKPGRLREGKPTSSHTVA